MEHIQSDTCSRSLSITVPSILKWCFRMKRLSDLKSPLDKRSHLVWGPEMSCSQICVGWSWPSSLLASGIGLVPPLSTDGDLVTGMSGKEDGKIPFTFEQEQNIVTRRALIMRSVNSVLYAIIGIIWKAVAAFGYSFCCCFRQLPTCILSTGLYSYILNISSNITHCFNSIIKITKSNKQWLTSSKISQIVPS